MNRTPCLPGLFSDAPVAPPAVTMAPAAIEARREGHAAQRGPRRPTRSMLLYRDALRAIQPATDHDVAARAGLPLASVNARRADWLALDPTCIEAVDRVKSAHASRARWQIRPASIADTGEVDA